MPQLRRAATSIADARAPGWFPPIVNRENSSEPEHDLGRAQIELRRASPVSDVALEGRLEQEIPQQRVTAADFDAGDRRFPVVDAAGSGKLAEPQVVEPRRRVQAGADLVSSLDERRNGSERQVDGRRRDERDPPVAHNRFEPYQVVVPRVLGVGAERRLGEAAVRLVRARAPRGFTGQVRAARGGYSENQPG